MVAVAVGQQDMRGPGDGLGPAGLGEHRVAAEPGVDQDDSPFGLQAEAGMAEPGEFQWGLQFRHALRRGRVILLVMPQARQ